MPVDARVQRTGGALNGFLSETIFAHPRYKGSLFPYTQGGWAGHFNCVLDRVVYFDCVVEEFDTLEHASGDVRNKGGKCRGKLFVRDDL